MIYKVINTWHICVVASLVTICSTAETSEWSVSGHVTPEVHDVFVDQSTSQLSMLLSLQFDNQDENQRSVRLVTFDLSSTSRVSDITLAPRFDLRSSVSLHTELANNRFAIAHKSIDGNVIRVFDTSGRQVDRANVGLTSGPIGGLYKLGSDYALVTIDGIVLIDSLDLVPRTSYSVPQSMYISSTSLSGSKECPLVVLLGDSIDEHWSIRSLCESDAELFTNAEAHSVSSVLPGIYTRIIGRSIQRQRFWIAGPDDSANLRISACMLGEDMTCSPTTFSSSLPRPPLLATRLPVQIMSDSKVVIAKQVENDFSIEMLDMTGMERSEIQSHNFSKDGEPDGSHRRLIGVYMGEIRGSIVTLSAIVVMPSSDPETFVRDGYRFEYHIGLIHPD